MYQTKEIHINEIDNSTNHHITYLTKIGSQSTHALFDSGASMSVMSQSFFEGLQHKPKMFPCKHDVYGAGGDSLGPLGECYLQIQIGKKVFRDRVVILRNLTKSYILGLPWQRINKIGTGYNRRGQHSKL